MAHLGFFREWSFKALRFILGIVAILVLSLIGLLIYGQMLEPETKTIETDVEINEATDD